MAHTLNFVLRCSAFSLRKPLASLAVTPRLSARYFSSTMDAFKKDQVVPEVLDAEPPALLKIVYGDGKIDVKPGQVLTPTQVKDMPKIEFAAEKGAFYTLVFTDPDAPSRKDPKFREFLHWLVFNAPDGNIAAGEHRAEFIGSGPPKGTGLHRYVFAVYKQPGKMDFSKIPQLGRALPGRPKRPAREVLKEAGLSGAPLVAANFYQAEYDDYVPHLFDPK